MPLEQYAVPILAAIIGWVLRHYGIGLPAQPSPQSRLPVDGTFPPPAAQANPQPK